MALLPTRVALLEADEEFRQLIPEKERPFAERAAVVPGFQLPAGEWDPETVLHAHPQSDTALLLNGILTLDIGLAGTTSSHLHGPGEPLRPWTPISHALPSASRWTVSGEGATIAILGSTFARLERRWPQLGTVLRRRFAEQANDAAVRTAILTLPRVEQRVLSLLWHLGERWGTVGPDGVTIHLKLTHELVGRLVGAKRPTVSLALTALTLNGDLQTTESGSWLLNPDSLSFLDGSLLQTPRTSAPIALNGRAGHFQSR